MKNCNYKKIAGDYSRKIRKGKYATKTRKTTKAGF
jgi:hypothetical protein